MQFSSSFSIVPSAFRSHGFANRRSRTRRDSLTSVDIQSFIDTAGEHITSDPSLFRGVYLSTLLYKFGFWLRKSPSKLVMSERKKQMLYDETIETTSFWQFLSHSWHAPGALKALCMLAFYNAVPSHIAGVVAAGVCLLLTIARVLPAWNGSASSTALKQMAQAPGSFGDKVDVAGWCILFYVSTYLCCMLFFRPICCLLYSIGECFGLRRSSAKIVFLDRLSIHQGNAQMKLKGIKSLGYFLAKAEEYVVIWDETFFQRVWCVFEFGVYNSVQPNGKIVIVPMLLYCLQVVMSLVCATFWLSWSFAVSLGLPQEIMEVLLDAGLPERLVIPLLFFAAWPFAIGYGLFARIYHRSRLKIGKQLQTFQVDHAKCAHESDREEVIKTIKQLYGSVDTFERYVQEHCHYVMHKAALGFRQLPWWMNFSSMSLPNFIGLAFDNWLALEKTTSSCRAHFLAGAAITSFLHWPLLYYVFENCFTFQPFTRNKATEFVVLLVEGFAATLVVSLWAATWGWVFAESLLWKCVSVICGMAAFLIVVYHQHAFTKENQIVEPRWSKQSHQSVNEDRNSQPSMASSEHTSKTLREDSQLSLCLSESTAIAAYRQVISIDIFAEEVEASSQLEDVLAI